MQKWIHGATRRAAALLLGAALLTSAMVPAVPAWAQEPGETQTASVAGQTPENAESDGGETASAPQKEDAAKQTPANAEASGEEAADGQEELILLYQPGDGEQQTLKDGAVLDSFSSWSFGEMSLCRGDENNPVLKADTTVQLISHATGQEIPTEVMRATELNDNYAVYNFWVINGEAEADYFAGISPDFAFDIVFTAGDESLTVTVENKGVEVAVSAGPNQVNQVGQDQYQVDLGVRSVSSPSLEGFQANPGWVISQPTLSGDLAGYFTLGDFTQEGVQLNPTEALAALPDYTMVEGTLNYVSKLDGQSYSSVLQYTKSSTWLSWCYWDGQPQNGWVDEPSVTLSEGQKGSLQLRLYPSMLPPDEGGTPISLTQEELSYDLPQGITARLLDDQTTLQLEYDLSSADVRDAVYWVCAQPASGGIYRFNISVLGAEKYALARYISGDKYEYTDIHYPYIDMSSLRENYALIPLSDGKPATTREELENSVLRVEDEEHPGSFQMVARQVQYQDKEGNTSTVWAWAIMPIVEMTEPSNPMEKRTFSIYDSQDTLLGKGSYSISGAGGTALQADHMETLSVGENTSMAQKFYSVQDEAGQPLVLTEAPQVTGEAAQNISVIWAPGLSSIRVDFNSDQVPGEVQVELRSGDTVRRLLYHFRAFQESALYYSTGTDFYHRSYTESLALTESLSGLSSGIVQPVNTTRFAEDGSFELYLYSRQYISDKLQDTADHLASKYSFASELVKSIRFVSSDEEILKIDGEISQSQAVDPVFSGNGYSNPEGKCFGVRLTPGGKAGSCDVYAEIELNRPSLNDPFGCDMEKTPEKVTIGYTFTVQKDTSGQEITANPDTLQQVLEDITIGSEPTVVVLEGGEYPMDLNLDGKNLILRSADPENPAVFTGASGAQGGFIITVNSPSPSFALEGLVLDGKGVRGGILQKDTGGDPSIGFTVQDCTIRNCTTGIQGYIGNNCVVKNTTIENCELGVTGCALSYCALKNNTCAAQEDYYSNIRQAVSAIWCRFVDNGLDYKLTAEPTGAAEYTLNLQQNYWNGSSKPSVQVQNRSTGEPLTNKTLHLYTSPYYITENLDRLNVDLDTAQMEDDTLMLPLVKSETGEGGMTVTSDAFATIQGAGAPAEFPIRDTENSKIAQWDFQTITNPEIDTNLNVEESLSEDAQAAVDSLPQGDQDKILQEVNLSHNGQLPGRAILHIKASQVPPEGVDKLCLYWVKSDGTIVPAEVIDVSYDEAEGYYLITVDHCSEYVITSGELEGVEEPDQNVPEQPGETVNPGEEGGSDTSGNPSGQNKPSKKPESNTPAVNEGNGTPAADETTTPVPQASTQGTTGQTGAETGATPTQSKLYNAQQVMEAFEQQTENVLLDVSRQSAVSQKAFELLQERPDAELRLAGDGFVWIFAGNQIESTQVPGGAFDAGITMEVSEAVAERIGQVAGESPWFGFETAYSGQLPGPAQLQIQLKNAEFAGMECGLYWLPDDGKAQRIDTVQVDEDGIVTLNLDHCSVYFLVAEKAAEPVQEAAEPEQPVADQPQTVQPEEPQAGKSSFGWVAAAVAVIVVAGAAAWAIKRKKRG